MTLRRPRTGGANLEARTMPDCSQQQSALDALVQRRDQDLAICDDLPPQGRAQCRNRVFAAIGAAEAALLACKEGVPAPGVRAISGHVVFLRANDGGFGPPNDFLDAEVVFSLDSTPGRAFGVKLENPGREAMLALLRD